MPFFFPSCVVLIPSSLRRWRFWAVAWLCVVDRVLITVMSMRLTVGLCLIAVSMTVNDVKQSVYLTEHRFSFLSKQRESRWVIKTAFE